MKRRFIVPEVVQTSSMDCGPAALHALFTGHGLPSSYGRLREACQTDVDGTSIDALEAVANQMGLMAEQVMLPVDWITLREARAFPCIAVLRLANDLTHFAVLWRRHGSFVQVMDPASGRRWVRWTQLREDLYRHRMPVPASAWLEWMGSEEARTMLIRRASKIGVRDAKRGVDTALGTGDWRVVARLDAAVRLLGALQEEGQLPRRRASRALAEIVEADEREPGGVIPERFASVLPSGTNEDMVILHGAVLLKTPELGTAAARGTLPPELEAAREEGEPAPFRALYGLVKESGRAGMLVLLAAALLGALTIFVEGILIRALFEIGADLEVTPQRLIAFLALLVFMLGMLLPEVALHSTGQRLGRHLETRMRLRFLQKIVRLPDRYLQSRPISDLAKRCHALAELRILPDMVARLALLLGTTAMAVGGIIWLAPFMWPLPLAAGATAVLTPLLFRKPLEERDLRVRTHAGALGTFYMDAVLAQSAVRAHAAEHTVEREHDGLLAEWGRAAWMRARSIITLTITQMGLGLLLTAAQLIVFILSGGSPASALLVAYWAAMLPGMGEEISYLIRLIPSQRNIALRLLEVIDAPEAPQEPAPAPAAPDGAAHIKLSDVHVVAAGHRILNGVDLEIEPGEHVAVVGRSGAGKSTLLSLLLGWHRTASGDLCIDGEPLTPGRLSALRGRTAWVDPAVQLWNRSFADNARYGLVSDGAVGRAIADADLVSTIAHLEEGMQTPVGESGRRLSGGEGQRLRLARALAAPPPSLVLLDEPFRGLERPRRRALLARARRRWSGSTLLMVSHDVLDTRNFPRVLVVEDGRIVEDGDPADLERTGGRYAELLSDERHAEEEVWAASEWTRLELEEVR